MSETYIHGVNTAHFLFTVDGIDVGWFKTVTGLEVTVETEDVLEGGQNSYTHKLPGRMTWPNVVFTRGITDSDNLLEWFNKSSGEKFAENENKLARSTASIALLSPAGERLRAWDIDGAFPVRWSGPSFAVDDNSAAAEELEITHHGFRTGR